MNLKTLLQAICFCSECNWEVTYYKGARSFYVYPDNNKPNEERPCYRFTTDGEYTGKVFYKSTYEITLTTNQINYLITHGIKEFIKTL